MIDLVAVCFLANDPLRLARFWAEALRWQVADHSKDQVDGQVHLVPTDGTTFGLTFRPDAGHKAARSRMHIDLTTRSLEDQQETVASLIALGGSHVDIGQDVDANHVVIGEGHVVLADPEGNEFCVIGPNNKFLADCGRLGAVNCDGTRESGVFWAEVLRWPLIWDQDEETAIRAPNRTGPIISWGGPPVMPKVGKSWLHFDISPKATMSHHDELARLVDLGGKMIADDSGSGFVMMTDPDDNEFRFLRTP